MAKTIVKIAEELCNGCGECFSPCEEGALALVDGKAKVISEELCDGAGVCIGHCPVGALSLEKRPDVVEIPEDIDRDQSEQEVLHCHLCQRSEADHYLLQVRKNGENRWVCTRCLPALIHG